MSGLFRRTHAAQNSILKGLRAQTSIYGGVIPLIYGRARVPGNILWYGDFVALKQKAQGGKGGLFGGGGKGGGSTYVYRAAVAIALGIGPMSALYNVYDSAGQLTLNTATETYTVGGGLTYTAAHAGATTFYGDFGVTRGDAYSVGPFTDFGSPSPVTLSGTQQTPMVLVLSAPGAGQYMVSATGTYTFSAADTGKVMTLVYAWSTPYVASPGSTPPITLANLTFFNGAQGQAAWGYLTTNHSSQALGYTGVAYVGSPSMNLGSSGALPNLTFEVGGLLPFGGGIIDSNPRDVLYDLLTNALYGLGFPSGEIGDLSNYSAYCVANGLFMSPVFDSDQAANQWIKPILEATNSEMFMSGGFLKIVPYGDTTVVGNGATYSPQTQPVYDLNDDDFVHASGADPVRIERPTLADVFNNVKVEYEQRASHYNKEVIEEFDQNAIETNRLRQTSPTAMHFYKATGPAQQAANIMLKRQVYIRRLFHFTLDRRYILLDPMDMVTLTDANLGLSKTPVRLREIHESGAGDLDITAEEFPWGTAHATLFPKEIATPFLPNANADPGSVNAPVLFEALSRMNDQIGHAVWMGLSGASPQWGGCTIWASTDGTTYKAVGKIFTSARMGVLTSALASHADPDTVDSFAVDLTQSFGQLSSGVAADADNFRTLCYVGGELVSYQTATLGTIYNYTLGTRLRRGVFNSTIGLHSIGAQFLRLDENVFAFDYDLTLIGTTMHFKFTSFNLLGNMEQSLAGVTDYTYAITGNSLGLLTPAHATYRPTSNPLTATDAGASTTINIASFAMRIPGIPDITDNSGSITGLAYNTLYYVYYDDPGFLGGAVTYAATTTKENALIPAGRFFVGSILTPQVGTLDTNGDDDGGSGAQNGMLNMYPMSVVGTIVSGSGTGSITNSQNAVDGDQTTFTQMDTTATGVARQLILNLSSASAINRRFSTAKLKVLLSVPTNNPNPLGTPASTVNVGYTIQGLGGIFTAIETNIATTQPLHIVSVIIPRPVNLSQIVAQIIMFMSASSTTGSIQAKVYDAWIEASE